MYHPQAFHKYNIMGMNYVYNGSLGSNGLNDDNETFFRHKINID